METTATVITAEVPHIRAATLADAQDIAALGARVFRETFDSITKPADMRAFLAETYSAERLASELADPTLVFFAARVGKALAGFAQLRQGPCDSCVRGPAPVELQRLYIDARWHGRGIAQALIRRALAWAAGAGYETWWLGVGDTNFRAQRFYEKLGLKKSGSHVFMVGTDPQLDFVLESPIAHAACLLGEQ